VPDQLRWQPENYFGKRHQDRNRDQVCTLALRANIRMTLLTSVKVVRNAADISTLSCAPYSQADLLRVLGRGSIAIINLKKSTGASFATRINSSNNSGFAVSLWLLAVFEPVSPINCRSR
jgi:hypothetical protein